MVRFSTNTEGSKTIRNRAGGHAYKLSSKEALVQIVTTSLFKEPKYYGDVKSEMDTALEAVAKKEPEFILKLAAYCRNELYLRTISIYLLVKAANIVECKPFVKQYTPMIVNRADEIYEALACHIDLFAPKEKDGKHNNKKIPNSLKKGLRLCFTKFDEYQYGKYNRKHKVTFKDAIMLTRPKKPSDIIKKILDDKLETPYTWETELSANGNTAEVWHKLIDSGKLPYMATLRNINNLEKAKVDANHFEKAVYGLADADKVKKAKQFPFRYYSALKNISISDPFKRKNVENALSQALEYSTKNLPKLKGRTFVAVDLSGSMHSNLSARGSIQYVEVGALMGAMANTFSENAIVSGFGQSFQVIKEVTIPGGSILGDARKIMGTNVGHSTNGHLAIEYLLNNNIETDRVIVFTDEQLWDSSGWDGNISKAWSKYETKFPNSKIYIVNLNGYGNSCLDYTKPNVIQVSGWSDKILKFIATYEEGKESFIRKIESYS